MADRRGIEVVDAQSDPGSGSHFLEKRIAALEALYRRFGRDGMKEQPLADVGLLLSSKEMQFRDAARHNLTTEQQAANRQLELEIKDLKLYIKSQAAGLSLDDLRSYAPSRQEQQQGHYRQKERGR